MKSLTQRDATRRNAILLKLEETRLEALRVRLALEAAVDNYNARLGDYVEAVNEATGFAEDMAAEIENYMDERSDAWRDGDKGTAYSEWLAAFQNFAPDEPAPLTLEDEAPNEDAEDDFRALPATPDEA